MPRSAPRRRIATVLFLDIVGSTALASELGDARWRELLTRFRRIVRADLKRFGGREQDTAGDGFFATFGGPAPALSAAAAIVTTVQKLGVDVRCGLHTGECEEIDGKLGGIAAHIGARVMSLAGPAEVLTTRTVRDLVAGSGTTFEERGSHELKGVEGTWDVLAVRAVETPLPPALSPEEAAERLGLLGNAPRRWTRRHGFAAVGIAAVVAAAIAVPLVAVSGGTATTAPPASLVRIDAKTSREVGEVRDRDVSVIPAGMSSSGGALWQDVGNGNTFRVVERNLGTGRIERTIDLPSSTAEAAYGFGSIWVLHNQTVLAGPQAGTLAHDVVRVDELTGKTAAAIPIPGDVHSGTIAIGNGAAWVLETDGTLDRIGPITNRIVARYPTHAIETSTLIPLQGYEWICECDNAQVMRFDTRTRRSRTFRIAEHARLVGVDSADRRTLWLLDGDAATLTPMNALSGATGTPLGLSGSPRQAVVASGAVWVAAGPVVDRVDLGTQARTEIAMPAGVLAGSIAAGPNGTIWVANIVPAPTG